LVASALHSDVMRDLQYEDVFCLLNCVMCAFANQRGRHAKCWNRASLVAVLAADPAVSDVTRSEFGVEALIGDQACLPEEFHVSVRDAIAKSVQKKSSE
jgi:hypothetical protein